MKKGLIKAIAILLTLVMLTGVVPAGAIPAKNSYDPPVNFGVISDPHYFPESYVNNESEVYFHEAYCDSKLMGESRAIIKAALETIAARKANGHYNMDYLLLPGDLTFEGEKLGHTEFAALLKAFESETGIEVFVINGNHDINNYSAVDYNGVNGGKITARDDPERLFTTPEIFKEIYADFGYNQADEIFKSATGKAGGLSYSIGLSGGYRLIAIDSCVYSRDVTASGRDTKESTMSITPELADWVVTQTREAAKNGETVIAMVHGSLVEHFDLQKFVSKNSTIFNNEELAGRFADAGMHFIFTGHMHCNDVASFVSGNDETIYDIETCELSAYPCTYREASFSKGLVQGHVSCKLESVAADAESFVDVSNISEIYGMIERPFSENYCKPMLYGGSIEDGVSYSPTGYFDNSFLFRATDAIKEELPDGLAGYLRSKGVDIGAELTKSSPTLKAALKDYNLTPEAFSQFLTAVVARIDNKYILDTAHTEELISAVVSRFAGFEIVPGDSETQFGKIAMLILFSLFAGDEDPESNPEILRAVSALRTQAGADRLVSELLDIIINDILFNDILPSISLNELDLLLPTEIMVILREIAGDDLTVGGILDLILDNAANRLNRLPFVRIDSGRDLLKALIYTAGAKYLNAKTRLDISKALAGVITSFAADENPGKLCDNNTTLYYKGKITSIPTAENYRLPADITLSPGLKGEVIITWSTLPGIEGNDCSITPLTPGSALSCVSERFEKDIPAIDLGFVTLYKTKSLLKHTVTVSGLETGIEYTFQVGDSTRGLMSEEQTLTIDTDGTVNLKNADRENSFFVRLTAFYAALIDTLRSLKTILMFFI